MSMNIRYYKGVTRKLVDSKRDKPRGIGVPVARKAFGKLLEKLSQRPKELPEWPYVVAGIAGREGVECLEIPGQGDEEGSEEAGEERK